MHVTTTEAILGSCRAFLICACLSATCFYPLHAQQITTLNGHEDSVIHVSFGPMGEMIVSAAYDSTLRCWSVSKRAEEWRITIPDKKIQSAAAYGHRGPFAVGTAGGDILVWTDASTKKPVTLQGHSNSVWSMAFGPRARRLISGSADKRVIIWNVSAAESVRKIDAHSLEVEAVAVDASGLSFASTGRDRTSHLWALPEGDSSGQFSDEKWFRSLTFSPDGRFIAAGASDGTITVFSTTKKSVVRTERCHSDVVACLAYSPDGDLLVSGSWDKQIKLRYAQTGELKQTFRGHRDAVSAVAFSPDGRNIASGSWDKTIKIWTIDD